MEKSYRNSCFLIAFLVTCTSVFIAHIRMTIHITSHYMDSYSFEIPVQEEFNDVKSIRNATQIHHRTEKQSKNTNKRKNYKKINADTSIHGPSKVEAFDAMSSNTLTKNVEIKIPKQPVKEIWIDPNLPIVKILLLRAIGNALPPRHNPEQAYENLKFTLEHEYEFPHLEKIWVMNRIIDTTLLRRLEALLESHHQTYLVIPFELTEYAKINYRFDYFNPRGDIVHDNKYVRGKMRGKKDSSYQVDEAIYQDKNLFVTNQNAVRNFMIDYGQNHSQHSDWILPWDGNCFIHPNAYQEIYTSLQKMPSNTHKYAFTSMNRAQSNDEVLQEDYIPHPIEEPQVAFHKTAVGRFHPLLRYGRRNKVEFLQRLKIKGPWDSWSPFLEWEKMHLGPFNQPIPDLPPYKNNTKIRKAGFVTRLASGQQHLEVKGTIHARGVSRFESMALLLGKLDTRVAIELFGYRPGQLVFYHEDALERDRELYRKGDTRVRALVSQLETLAQDALKAGPWSVTDKPDDSVAASGDKHDYYHLSPYYWPRTPELAKDPTHQWKRRDGIRFPGTELYEPGSEKFDRTRVKDMQYNTTVLGLAYYMTGNEEYANVAARNIRTWFLDPETRMNPHMKYAQVKRGYNNNTGISFGIIEMKDLYFMLDAVRIVQREGFLTEEDQSELRAWFTEYLKWMETSEIGKDEYIQKNNHGLYFDVQAVAVASFINDTAKMIWYAERSTSRLLAHIAQDGSMPQELLRPTCEHYQMFTLQGWSILSRLLVPLRRNRWTVPPSTANAHPDSNKDPETFTPLCRAAKYAIPFFGRTSRCKKSTESGENTERWWPLLQDARYNCPSLDKTDIQWPISWFPRSARRPPGSSFEMPFMYDPHDGIAPFWNLGLLHANKTWQASYSWL